MKSILLALVCCVSSLSIWAQSSAQERLNAAYSASERAALSSQEQQQLLLNAEKLCWFEPVKADQTGEVFTLTSRQGQPVTLSNAQLADFNPLLYSLPQDEVRCENLRIQTLEGDHHLLIVRSKQMMQREAKAKEVKTRKTAAK
ncbi:MAG: hypothetical protein ACK478_11170 [Flavobacteriales bacterium]|jgi:hypothetical protein